MTTLLLAEHDNERLNEATAKALTAALQLGGDVHVLVAGQGAQAVAEEAVGLAGVAKVLLAEGEHLAHDLAEPLAALLARIAEPYEAVVAAATTAGKNVMPRLAALLDVMQVSEIVEVVAPDTFRRTTYAGNAVQTVKSRDARKVVTVRTTAFQAAEQAAEAAPIEEVDPGADAGLSRFVEERLSESARPELAAARIVVSGGRGVGSREKFAEVIEPFADRLGAAIGASRAAVDAGYAPNEWQVGQTGKVVAPELYIAAGISGAIQHLAGMKDSKVIVAINKDADAPIFQVADYGLVGDLFQLLPEIEKTLDKGG